MGLFLKHVMNEHRSTCHTVVSTTLKKYDEKNKAGRSDLYNVYMNGEVMPILKNIEESYQTSGDSTK